MNKPIKIIIISLFMLSLMGCTNDKRKKAQTKHVVRAFAGHLYIHYSQYSTRDRKDNTGKFKGTWPLNPKAHNPHNKPGAKPLRMD